MFFFEISLSSEIFLTISLIDIFFINFLIFFLSDSSSSLKLNFSFIFSEIITVISPFLEKLIFDNSWTGVLMYSSWYFVISLQINISLFEKNSFMSSILLLSLLGDIKNTNEHSNFDISLNKFLIWFFFRVKIHKNKNYQKNHLLILQHLLRMHLGLEKHQYHFWHIL